MPPDSTSFLDNLIQRLPDWFKDDSQFELARMTRRYYPYTALFSPIQVNTLRIKNRIVMGPMGNISMAEEMGRPANKMIQYFTERARGGVGLITSGLVPISQTIDPTVTELGDRSYFPRIDRSRTVFSGWRILAEAVHAFGAHFFIQLTPGLGRVGSPESLIKKYQLPVSASWNPNFYLPDVPCRPLTDWECRRIIHAAGQAAADAKAITIDGVYLHGHEGYLLEQMTNPAFNHRKIGRYVDWQVFGIELIEEIRKRVGPTYPIMYRIDLSLALNATYGERMRTESTLRGFRHERTVEETLAYMQNLVKAGVDLFDVDLGCYDNWWLPHPPNTMPSGCYLGLAKLVKDTFAAHRVKSNAGLPVPVVGVGKLGYPDLAEKALRDGLCDMVMLARPLLADPYWPNKAYAGRVDEIVPCVGDQEGCINEFVEGGHPQCSVNPRSGFEDVLTAELPLAPAPRKIAVVGAGPAGIICAITAARRGHKVDLYDQRGEIGGMLVPGSAPRAKYEVANYLAYLRGAVERCGRENPLRLHLNTSVTPELLLGAGYDALIICTGGMPALPGLPGVDGAGVYQAVDIFRSPGLVSGAGKIVVVGGGSVGCEVAHFLASEHGKQVKVIEMLNAFMVGKCTANRGHLIHELERLGVELINAATLKSIQPGSVTMTRNVSKTVPNPYNTWNPLLPENIKNPLARPVKQELHEQNIPADGVILALGLHPNTALYDACLQAGIAPEIRRIGDAFNTGRIFEAVKAGYAVGRSL